MYGWRKLRPSFFPAQGRPPKKGIHGRIKWSGCQRIQQAMSGGWEIRRKRNRIYDRNVKNTRHIYEIACVVSWSLSLLNYNCEKQIARYTSANKNTRVDMAIYHNRDTNTGQLTFPRDHCAIHEHKIKSRPTTPHPTSSAQKFTEAEDSKYFTAGYMLEIVNVEISYA